MNVASTRVEDGIAVVTIDNPPVNMGNAALRRSLLEAFEQIAARTDLRGVVVASARDHFYSGSDIKEFDGEVARPLLTEVIQLIDGIDIPVVAALNGMTLGGGLEVALGCDVRIAEPKARLGLPETTLGMLPGAGGTVRLPRIVGVPKAIEMISTGKPVTAEEALRLGLIDQIVPREDLLTTAIAAAGTAAKRRVRLESVPLADEGEIAAAVEAANRKRKARPNVLRAIDLIMTGVDLDSADALARERVVFDELRVGQEARNLRYLFFAKRAAAKALSTGGEPRAVQTVGIGGAGTMGAAIAAVCLGAGLSVILFDLDDGALGRARGKLEDRATAARRWGALETTTDIAAFAAADLVIDAVFEELQVKVDFLTAIEAVVGTDTVLASNTSYLDLDEIGRALGHPERLAGLHFFNPADRNPLVEVVRTAAADDATMATLAASVRTFGKTGIAARVGEGFVANRVYSDYRGQSEIMLEDGASPQQVDEAMIALGLPIGPFAVGDMSGLDIAWARRKRLAAGRDPEQRYVTIPDSLCEAGRLGKKTGAGWYSYADDASRGAPDPLVDAVIDEARRAKGITPRLLSTEEIQQRAVCAMLIAAAAVVESGVAAQASDVDVALTEGFAFPTWLGGPVRYCATQPAEWVIEGLRIVHASDPIGYASAEPASRGELPASIQAVLAAVS